MLRLRKAIDGGGEAFSIRDVDVIRVDRLVGLRERIAERFEFTDVAVHQTERPALGRELLREREAKPARGARDDGALAGKIQAQAARGLTHAGFL